MATSYFVTVPIGSEFGFKRPNTAPLPVMETIKTLESSVTIEGTRANIDSRVIEATISNTGSYVFPKFNTSTFEVVQTYGINYKNYLKEWTLPYINTLTVTNVGNSPVIVQEPRFSPFDFNLINGVFPVLHSATGTFTLAAGASRDIEIGYYGTEIGDFSNYVTITSNAGISTLTVYTSQIVVDETFDFIVSPTSIVNTATFIGQQFLTPVFITPVYNGVVSPEIALDYTVELSEGVAWSFTTTTNRINLLFDSDRVDNVNGVYTSTLFITANNLTKATTSTHTISIDFSKYGNLATWMSAAAPYNSIIGISLDKMPDPESTGTIKVLTIGVGTGGDGSPIYANDGNIFAQLNSLGVRGGSLDTPYPYWSTAYAFPLTNTAPARYKSGELDINGAPKFMKKTTEGLNYHDYFGDEGNEGTMFVVDYDGFGVINISLNNLRELSGNEEFDTTLKNITRAFHYYSGVDDPGRYYQLDGPIIDGTVTTLFRGFMSPRGDASTWTVDVSIVDLPR